MDAVRVASGVPSSVPVRERNGGGSKRQADAFRRALADGSGSGEQQGARTDEGPVRRRLQPTPPGVRKDEGLSRHVDVIA